MQNMFKVNNRSTKHCSGVFMLNFEYIYHVVPSFWGFFADLEYHNDGWDSLLP